MEEEGNGLARISHPMPMYLIWNENQSYRSSAHARQTKHTQETNCQSLDLRQTPNTHKGVEKEKGRPERSAHLLPTYLIWYEDQGDVVPLNRGETLT